MYIVAWRERWRFVSICIEKWIQMFYTCWRIGLQKLLGIKDIEDILLKNYEENENCFRCIIVFISDIYINIYIHYNYICLIHSVILIWLLKMKTEHTNHCIPYGQRLNLTVVSSVPAAEFMACKIRKSSPLLAGADNYKFNK